MESKDSSKVVRFRVSASELEELDASAKAAKMSRSEYLRSCLALSNARSESVHLVQIATTLRWLQLSLGSYIKLLELMMSKVEGLGQEQSLDGIRIIVTQEMEGASKLKGLFFETETLAGEVLNELRSIDS